MEIGYGKLCGGFHLPLLKQKPVLPPGSGRRPSRCARIARAPSTSSFPLARDTLSIVVSGGDPARSKHDASQQPARLPGGLCAAYNLTSTIAALPTVTPILSFDIETVPDVAGIRLLTGFDDTITDHNVVEYALQRRRAEIDADFVAPHLQKVVAIAAVLGSDEGVALHSFGAPELGEAGTLAAFFALVEKHAPRLVSWAGSAQLPALHCRALMHGVAAPRYWEQDRHLDLAERLALASRESRVSLVDIARLSGLPGKAGLDRLAIWHAYENGRLDAIRAKSETDAVYTCLVHLRFEHLAGRLSPDAYRAEVGRVRRALEAADSARWRDFLAAWPLDPLGASR
ncbi:hypothetical protein DWG20_14310 [Crenobacter cavernae]|uniref:Predicted 3'-5' exonuclease PolB-like domain-containing protein n=1 Tax=Crenobacter cavernae TaxID=2290923 RepID=A0A345YAF6_9NEIS|nr:hypothetical protein DWG20_14310 [Crenobacter cavernae]